MLGRSWLAGFTPTCHSPLGFSQSSGILRLRPLSPSTSLSFGPSVVLTVEVSTSPLPEASITSTIFGRPSEVCWEGVQMEHKHPTRAVVIFPDSQRTPGTHCWLMRSGYVIFACNECRKFYFLIARFQKRCSLGSNKPRPPNGVLEYKQCVTIHTRSQCFYHNADAVCWAVNDVDKLISHTAI